MTAWRMAAAPPAHPDVSRHAVRVSLTFAAMALAGALSARAVWASDVLARPEASSVFRGLVILAGAGGGAVTSWRRQSRPFGPSALALAAVYAAGALTACASPAVYAVGRVALAAVGVCFLYLA